ncbi:MAG: sensor domain-containing diguanylate cyclase [Thermoleophilia bacterium]|jgi:diguanylate cyclase (GGDEF)-like protein|nr:sensor domain-containing diguanylate cyclase [Thermoleophilia bacterium]
MADFEAASRAVLEHLHERLGFGLWMVTRVAGEDWVVLSAEDHGYGVAAGSVFRWTDSFCSRMVRGEGPRFAPDPGAVPAYAEAPIARQVPIGSYVGVPLTDEHGRLFGTLCAIDPAPADPRLAAELPLVELLGGLLGGLLARELQLRSAERRAERAEVAALSDPVTGLPNRRAWDALIAREEHRCHRHGHPAAVLSIDLDGLKHVNDAGGHPAGDELIVRAAAALRGSLREGDVCARIGGDEFAVLGIETDAAGAERLAERARAALAGAGVPASVGAAARDPGRGLRAAYGDADRAMYAEKRARRSRAA